MRLTEADFEADASDVASARLRRRMVKWSRAMVARLGDSGALAVATVPDDAGTRCAILTAPAADDPDEERAAGRVADSPSQVAVVLRVDPSRVSVALEVPPSLAGGVRARVSDPSRTSELTAAVRALPEQFSLGIEGHEGRTVAPTVGADALARFLDRAGRARRALRIEWSIPRDIAIRHAALLDEELDGAIVALMDVLMLLSGIPRSVRQGGARSTSRAHPRRSVRGRVEEEGERPAGRAAAAVAVAEEGQAPPTEQDRPGADGAARLLIRSHAFSAPAARAKGAARDGSPADRSTAGEDGSGIERGSRVSVLEGPFSGKVGVVQELDGKGGARVMLGLLAVHMRVTDLAVSQAGRRRPLLSTSYRKPLPARPARS